MADKRLRAVEPGEKVRKARVMTIVEAIEAGDRLAELEATHRRIGKTVQDESTPARDLAALTRRQLEISKEIEALRGRDGDEGVVDDDASGSGSWSAEAI